MLMTHSMFFTQTRRLAVLSINNIYFGMMALNDSFFDSLVVQMTQTPRLSVLRMRRHRTKVVIYILDSISLMLIQVVHSACDEGSSHLVITVEDMNECDWADYGLFLHCFTRKFKWRFKAFALRGWIKWKFHSQEFISSRCVCKWCQLTYYATIHEYIGRIAMVSLFSILIRLKISFPCVYICVVVRESGGGVKKLFNAA